jgi:hypothetical protein
MDKKNPVSWFVLSCGPILGVTGVAKIISAFGHAKILAISDPIIGIRFSYLMFLMGCIELIIAFICVYTEKNRLAISLTVWLSTSLAGYRFGLWWLDWKRPCACLGTLTDALHFSPQLVDVFMKMILFYLLLGSYFMFFKMETNRDYFE